MRRKIIHIDMDAFFAAVEQRDNPELRGKPIAVGFDGPRGVLSTASYEARRYGVRSAMSVVRAKQLCPQLIIVHSRHEHYKDVSQQVHEIFHEYTDIIEPISLDEAFLDVTENKKDISLARDIAKEIKRKILDRVGLTASAGVSYNKFLAKIASDYNKPDGLFVVHPDRAMDFISDLRIEDFWGVGPKTARRMHQMGVFNGAQLRSVTLGRLTEVFGKQGQLYYDFARGIDNRAVESNHERKSVGCEQTFLEDIVTSSGVTIELYHILIELLARIHKVGFEGHTLTLKVRYSDFSQITRSVTHTDALITKQQILPLAKQLMRQVEYSRQKPIRLIGLAVSNPAASSPSAAQWVEGDIFDELF